MRNRTRQIICAFEELEQELSSWKYYEAVHGQGRTAALFLFFLKYLSDIEAVKKGLSEEDTLFASLCHECAKENSDIEPFLSQYIHKNHIQDQQMGWKDEGKMIVQYMSRLDFKALPNEFSQALKQLKAYDFSAPETYDSLLSAMTLLYGNIYDERESQRGKSLYEKHSEEGLTGIRVAAELVKCTHGLEIYDFSCGTGVLAALAAETDSAVYAQERNFEKAAAAYMLLRITGVQEIYMEVGDVLRKPVTVNYPDRLFDRIISAPPIEDKFVNASKLNGSKYLKEFLYEEGLDSGFWIYARHILEKLKADGRGVLIAPITILSREGGALRDRQRLLTEGRIDSVIQTPSDYFGILTRMKLCLIVLKKNEGYKGHEVYLADLTGREAQELFARCVEEDKFLDVAGISTFMIEKRERKGVSVKATIQEIKEREWNLTPAVYVRDVNDMMAQTENPADILEKYQTSLAHYHESEENLKQAIVNYYQLWEEKQSGGGVLR